MSVVPVLSHGSLTDDASSYAMAVASARVTFVVLTRPDSRPSQSRPSSQLSPIRPGQHGTTSYMPRYTDLAEWQRTVIRPVQKQFQPFEKYFSVSSACLLACLLACDCRYSILVRATGGNISAGSTISFTGNNL